MKIYLIKCPNCGNIEGVHALNIGEYICQDRHDIYGKIYFIGCGHTWKTKDYKE
jgi:hypothetical protein